MIGKFTGLQVLVLGISLGLGLLVFVSLTGAEIGFLTSLALASSVPGITMVVLFTLAHGKPKGYFFHWVEWLRIRYQNLALIEREPSQSKTAIKLLITRIIH